MAYVIIIIHVLLFGTVSSSTSELLKSSKDNLNKALVNHSVLDINGTSHHECARHCMSFAICKSIDYDRNDQTCKLNDIGRFSVDQSEFKTKKGSIFSDITEWPSKMVGSCSSRPCLENQRCYVNGNTYICRDMTCDIGVQIKNGKIKASSPKENRFRDKALVKCNDGYVPSQPLVECQASGQWQPASCEPLSDCKDILNEFPTAKSGPYEIKLWSSRTKMTVNCDMETEGGGWTVFHRRMDGSMEFYRNFTEYENGFGNVDGELWLGLKHIQELAEQGPTELRLDMTKKNNDKGHETFQDFRLTGGINYTLNIGLSKRNSVDLKEGLQFNNGRHFSTFDRDLDPSPSRNCAVDRHGAWWYNICTYVNLNGLYVTPDTLCTFPGAEANVCGHIHHGFNGRKALKSSSMMLRRN